jgi:hypothetical protein
MKRNILAAITLGLMSMPAQATTYDLTFNNNSTAISNQSEVMAATFNPITLFNGDGLSITFNNVPLPTVFPALFPATLFDTSLYALSGGGVLEESFGIFGPLLMDEEGSHFRGFGGVGGLDYSSSWTMSVQLLTGDPPDSSGLTVNRVWAQVALVPEPSTCAMMLIGFAAIGFAGYRRSATRKPASHRAQARLVKG